MKDRLFILIIFSFLLIIILIAQQLHEQALSENHPLWSIGENMPTARTEIAATIIDDHIYVIGGFDKTGKVLDTVEVYNIETDSWKTVAPLPQPLHHAAATTFNDSLYVIGGYTNSNWLPSNRLFIYDPKNDTWSEGPPMPTARGALSAAFVDKMLFAVGGEGKNRIMNINEAYNLKTNEWITKSSMPTARHHAASATVDGNVYIIGGRVAGVLPINNVNVTEMYDTEMDKWAILDPIPSKISGSSAASINNTIYVFGGEDITKTYNYNEKYKIKTNKWESQEPLPTARHGLSAISFNHQIYVIGGGPLPGLSVTNVNEIFYVKK